MKRRILPFILATVLVLFSVPFATTANTTTPTVYLNLTFDGDEIDAEDTEYAEKALRLSNATPKICSRNGSNLALQMNQTSASQTKQVQATFYLTSAKTGKLDAYGSDLVLSYDMYISNDNGTAFTLFQGRSASVNSWGNKITLSVADSNGQGTVLNNKVETETKITYGTWNTFAMILHPGTGDATSATCDYYVNGNLAIQGFEVGSLDLGRFHIGEFLNGGSKEGSFFVDNIRLYSGNKICSDAELGLVTSEIKGVQTSNASANAFNLRVISTVDSTSCAKAGFDIQAKYTDGTEKTVSGTKEITEVYTSITANEGAGIATYTAGDLGGNYLAALTINGVPTNVGKVEITVSAWTQAEDGVKYVTSVVLITYDTNANTPITVTVVPNSIPVNPAAQ